MRIPSANYLGLRLNKTHNCSISNYFTEEAPVVASLPHFYQVDPEIQDTIEGMNPVKEMHETAIDVEPVRNLWQIRKWQY